MSTEPTNPTPSRGRPPNGWKEVFITELRKTSNVFFSAKKAKVDRSTVYDHYDRDPEFAQAWESAIEDSVDVGEAELKRRAILGVRKPIIYRGQVTGCVREKSDGLLLAFLRAHRPEKWRENQDIRELIAEVAKLKAAQSSAEPPKSDRDGGAAQPQ